jgi:ornithine carbamoyltransferase
MKKRDLLSITDLSRQELEWILERASELKRNHHAQLLQWKNIGLLFFKHSTRTRISFEAAIRRLGGGAIFLNSKDLQLNRGEPIEDTARILSSYLDGLVVRAYSHQEVERLANSSSIPVINGLTDLLHPCQVISDIFTIREKFGDLGGIKIVYIGDGNNMANSWLNGAALYGLDLTLAIPSNYMPDEGILHQAQAEAEKNGHTIKVIPDPREASIGAHVLYTDVWVSMGQEEENRQRQQAFQGFQINEELLWLAAENVVVMHCLPAHRGEEITDRVMNGKHSVIYEQAANRLFVHEAILSFLYRDAN